MHPTPLQTILGLGLLSADARITFDAIVIGVFALFALVMRQRWAFMSLTGVVMCVIGFVFDLIATPSLAAEMGWPIGRAVSASCWQAGASST